ncbi:PTS sugar transporter subunit IIA [Sporolactobacillus nakayamae]|uniref:PTS system, mannose-specific IIA component n=1 Tax=Sporolactobacillus nakayamae TaxID=269670 RepID=A0A1I2TFI9_9BACL|nr:PTS fructose transporter subunit IIA [Sporolactobacillus nakayamae]SFG63650.1 PTS system, mannose-specific IIA component [Sporolactobacillus nakayamae]
MKKIIVATHYTLAKGFKETLDYLTGSVDGVQAICAYVNGNNQELAKTIGKQLNNDDECYILTDLNYGSVNQAFYPYMSSKVHLITGINLPLALEITLAVKSGQAVNIPEIITKAKSQIMYVNAFASVYEESSKDE